MFSPIHKFGLKAIALVVASSLFAACGGNGNTSSSSEDISSTPVSSSSSVAVSSSSVAVSSSSSVVSSSSSSVATGPSAEQGEILFGSTPENCSQCHGMVGNGVFGSNNFRFDVNDLRKTTVANLASYIEANMPPFGNEANCDASCAENIAAYLETFVDDTESSSSTAQSSSVNNQNAFIFEDFEDGSVGQAPAGWDISLPYPGATDSVYIRVDSSNAKNGSKSVHVRLQGIMPYQPYIMYKTLPSNWSKLYISAWVKPSRTLGGGTVGSNSDHAHFIGTSGGPDLNMVPPQLRFGVVRGGVIGGFLTEGDGATTDVENVSLTSGQWTCVEWLIEKNSSLDRMYGWVGGAEAFSAESSGDFERVASNSYTSNSTTYVNFGWFPFGNTNYLTDIWFDDILVSSERVGCN